MPWNLGNGDDLWCLNYSLTLFLCINTALTQILSDCTSLDKNCCQTFCFEAEEKHLRNLLSQCQNMEEVCHGVHAVILLWGNHLELFLF